MVMPITGRAISRYGLSSRVPTVICFVCLFTHRMPRGKLTILRIFRRCIAVDGSAFTNRTTAGRAKRILSKVVTDYRLVGRV